MTKGDLRRARKEARANGIPLDGELAVNGHNESPQPKRPVRRRKLREQHASREEQVARYIDCGPANWDDR